jgi:DNA invertase Pin-like site-specific DNA recombinase
MTQPEYGFEYAADGVTLVENALEQRTLQLIDKLNAGRMVFRMLSVLNEFERDQIAERTRAALQFKKSKGERVGEVPFGFTLHADGVQLVPCPSQQRVIEAIVSLRAKGLSLRAIAAEVEAAGAATKKGLPKWSAQMISNILDRHDAVK